MSYTAQGASKTDRLVDLYDKAKSGVQAATVILEDPAFPEVTRLVLELNRMEPTGGKGIGLGGVVKPLKAFVAFKRNPGLGYAALAAILAVPFLLGYSWGQR